MGPPAGRVRFIVSMYTLNIDVDCHSVYTLVQSYATSAIQTTLSPASKLLDTLRMLLFMLTNVIENKNF